MTTEAQESAPQEVSSQEVSSQEVSPQEVSSQETAMDRFRAHAIASVQQELAELAARRSVSVGSRARRRPTGPSTVFTLRLSHDELAALEARAALLGQRPSVWVRNVIRGALSERVGGVGSGAVTDAH